MALPVWLFVVVAAATGDALGLWTMSAVGYLGAWLFGATVSAGPTLLRGVTARGVDCSTFTAVAGRQSVRLGIEAALARSVYVVFLLLAAVMLSAESSGAVASAVLVFSPLSVVYVALSTFLVPTLVRANGIHVVAPGVLARIAVVAAALTSGWMIVLALANMAELAPGPFDLEIAEVSHALFFATGARFVGLSVWRAPLIALRVADATRESLAARWAATLAQWTLPVVGFSIGGLEWGAVLFAVATWFGAYLAFAQWLALRRAGGGARGHAECG